jgi:hypothetical protein
MGKTENRDSALDLEALLHPARAFSHPRDIVNDPDLTLCEKRAILASWASDACAVEAAPELRQVPGAAAHVRFDEIMEALQSLDRPDWTVKARSQSRRRIIERWRGQSRGEGGHPLN